MMSPGTDWTWSRKNEQVDKSAVPLEHCKEHAWNDPQLDTCGWELKPSSPQNSLQAV